MDESTEQICNRKIAIMKGREDMFKLLQNEYEEYFKELELIQRQYNQEEAYYFIINKLIRDSINDKDISVRDVHKVSTLTGKNAKKLSGRNKHLIGYDGQAPDFVILHNDFEESKGKDQSGKVYGCVEIKPFSKAKRKGGKDTQNLYEDYIRTIKKLLENKESVEAVHEKIHQNWIKMEFKLSEKKEEFIENYFKEDNNKSIPIDVMGEIYLCNKNGNLCKSKSTQFENGKIQLKIQMQNDKVVLVPRKMECEYLVKLKSKETKESFTLEKKVFDNDIVCQLLKELIGFKKVIFTNGYQWILMQCKEVKCSKPNFKIGDEKGIKVTSLITVKDFQCESIVDFCPEPNSEQWSYLKSKINEIFKEAKSKQGKEKNGNDE